MTSPRRFYFSLLILLFAALPHCTSERTSPDEVIDALPSQGKPKAAGKPGAAGSAAGKSADKAKPAETFANSQEFAVDLDDADILAHDVGTAGNATEIPTHPELEASGNPLAEHEAAWAPINAAPGQEAAGGGGASIVISPLPQPSETAASASSVSSDGGAPSPEAAKNFAAFKEHFANFLGGHPEGVFYVASAELEVYSGPSESFQKVGRLKRGDEVHVIVKKAEWFKIGHSRYVKGQGLNSRGIRTKGIDAYRTKP